jgi:ribosome biogenesis GTPase
LPTGGIRTHDAHGRHTTTSRHLFELPAGGLLIDTPGIREIALWGDEATLKDAFADVEASASNCRFADCQHQNEPDCAVREAIESGALSTQRLEGHRKLGRELVRVASKRNAGARHAERQQARTFGKLIKEGQAKGRHERGR